MSTAVAVAERPVRDLVAPKRRSPKDLAAALLGARPGDAVIAQFKTERYGTYRVVGCLGSSVALDGLVLAGEQIAAPGSTKGEYRPSTALVRAGVRSRAEAVEAGIDPEANPSAMLPSPPLAPEGRPSSHWFTLEHGDLACAVFKHPKWGLFYIEGHIVAVGESLLCIGGWVVAGPDRSMGTHLLAAYRIEQDADEAPAPAVVEEG